jgi:hypothetical protein
MIVGSAWNARMKPRDVSPCWLVVPGGNAKRPNRNFVPSVAQFRTSITRSFMIRKSLVPAGTTKIKKAKITCKRIPQTITLQLITLLSAEINHAKIISRKIPAKLTRL